MVDDWDSSSLELTELERGRSHSLHCTFWMELTLVQ